ncbi:MAG: COX15/CtaA family protein [Blastocatellia bacterium]|nr:COX15/CtaA family protein [Blastocatellia bacterium]
MATELNNISPRGLAGMSAFARYSLLTLAFNLLVILWGVFLRASKSGDGCGEHWLTCHGEVIPSAPEFKTVIEFSHRVTSGIAFLIVIGLLVWAFRKFPKGDQIRKMAVGSFIFILTEALVGAGLVLTGNTAENLTAARPFWAIGHLINTFILLAFLTLTSWMAVTGKRLSFALPTRTCVLVAIALIGILFVGISGSLAALSNMLFPSGSLAEGIAKDFSTASHYLLRLRLSHPILSILTAVYLVMLAGWLKKESTDDPSVVRWANILSILVIIQVVFGAATLLTLGPIVMQLGHLLLADLLWLAFVLMLANLMARRGAP